LFTSYYFEKSGDKSTLKNIPTTLTAFNFLSNQSSFAPTTTLLFLSLFALVPWTRALPECFTYTNIQFPFAFNYDFDNLVDVSTVNVLTKLSSRNSVAVGGTIEDGRLMLVDTGYEDNGFLAVVNLDLL
jgi:hypothetical protein